MITKSPRSNLRLVSTAGIVAAMLFGGAVSTASAAASLTPLGRLPGGVNSIALGVSGDGSVVVGSSNSASGQQAFRWTSDGGMVGLGDLPGGEFRSYANGVNGDGAVVVGYGTSDSGSGLEAFRWTAGGGMVGLGDLPDGGFSSVAYGVSGDGSVVVGYGLSTSGYEAFRWTAGGGMVGLGDLPGGNFESDALGVSGDGAVVVGYGKSASGNQAFRWTSDGGMAGLGYLPGGGFYSSATGVSGDGAVVVGDGISTSGIEAFRWTADGGMIGLDDLPGGEFRSYANGVSGDGAVIVGYGNSASGQEAFRWTARGGMQRLWDVLLAQGVNPAADRWTNLVLATGVSFDGNTIVGAGTRNGHSEAFVAVIPIVPEPAGDFNHDGTVDAADYVLWRKNNIDGESGYNTWRANFGATAAGAAAVAHSPTSVPEPATAALALLAVSGTLLLRRRSLWRPNKLKVLPFQALAAALTLAIALAPNTASAQEADTLTISSLFSMDYLYGTVGPDLAEVFANGHEHTWTLTLHGTSQSHETSTNPFGVTYYYTWIHATSFDLEFFGPDAATLNGIVSDHIAGGDVFIYLENDYSSGNGDDFSVMYVEPTGPDFQFYSDCDLFGCGTLFPTDADGYPVVGPDPFSIWNEYSALIDSRLGNDGYIQSRASLVTFVAVVPDPTGPPGDFNQDGIVDAADYVVWRKTGINGQQGYDDWRSHFGLPAGSGAALPSAEPLSAAVPEPASIVLAGFALATLAGLSLTHSRQCALCRPSGGAHRE